MKARPSRFGAKPRRFNTASASKFGGSRFGAKRGNIRGVRIDPARFVNKAIAADKSEQAIAAEYKFNDFDINIQLKKVIADKGYVNATPIQAKAIPQVLKGSDVVGIADTGTGKTAAFLVPLINKALSNPKAKVLIVAPTRELAAQIDQEFKVLSKGLKFLI